MKDPKGYLRVKSDTGCVHSVPTIHGSQICKYKLCSKHDPVANAYCCDACASDAYDYNRLHPEEE